MKNIKIISIYVLAILALSGCKYEQRKIISGAKKYLKSEYIPRLHDHKSYELAKIEIVDTVFVSNLQELIDTYKEINERLSEVITDGHTLILDIWNTKIQYVRSGRSTYQLDRRIKEVEEVISNAEKERDKYGLQIGLYYDWINMATNDSIVYLSIRHEFRAKNQMGGVVLDEQEILYFPKDKSYLIE